MSNIMPTLLVRGLLFAALWLALLPSLVWYDLLFGLLTAAFASYVSVQLMPPALGKIKLGVLLAMLPRFVLQSIHAGWDVAWRAFHPKMPLFPGFVRYSTHLSPGMQRNSFSTFCGLLPGSVACGQEDDAIVFHVLDHTQDHQTQLAIEEARIAHAFEQAHLSRTQ